MAAKENAYDEKTVYHVQKDLDHQELHRTASSVADQLEGAQVLLLVNYDQNCPVVQLMMVAELSTPVAYLKCKMTKFTSFH